MLKPFSEYRVVKPQRDELYCKLIPEPVCGLSSAKASLHYANLSLISLNSRQVCTLHITNKPQTHSHTLKPFRGGKKKWMLQYIFLFYKQKFQVLTGRWHSIMNILCDDLFWQRSSVSTDEYFSQTETWNAYFPTCFNKAVFFRFCLI